MKKYDRAVFVWVVFFGLALVMSSRSQDFSIVSIEYPGKVVFEQVPGAESYTVEWAPGPGGPWSRSWEDLQNIVPAGPGAVTAAVAMCYRVIAHGGSGPGTPDGMVRIPAGSFWMGDTMGDSGGTSDELPVHQVTITRPFFMDETLIDSNTFFQVRNWSLTNGYAYSATPSVKAASHPVYGVAWRDAIIWCNARSQMEGLTPCYTINGVFATGPIANTNSPVVCNWLANGYRLPTEAEWEYAARGGSESNRFPWANNQTVGHDRANYRANSTHTYDDNPYAKPYSLLHPSYNIPPTPNTSPVKAFAPNGYGLYDMTGNLSEICWDYYDGGYYAVSPSTDPTGPAVHFGNRVVRSGAFDNAADNCRVARRFSASWSIGSQRGFRTVRRAD